jgi:diaminopimelate epimerase
MRAQLVDDQVTVQMPGGNLKIRREKTGNLVQSGPARRVYRATVDLADFGQEGK